MRRLLWGLGLTAMLGAMLLGQPLAAAEIRILERGDANSWSVLQLSGRILAGDSRRLDAALRTLPKRDADSMTRLMLDSPGGDYAEALRLGRILRTQYIATRIAAGQRCNGACAFLFLGGGSQTQSTVRDWLPQHELEAGGRLVFEGLSRKAAAADAARGDGIGGSVIGGLHAFLRSLWMDPQFFADFLALKPGEAMPIDRVGRLRMLQISLLGVPPPRELTDQNLLNLCNWATGWERPLTFTPADPRDPKARVTKLDADTLARRLLLATLNGMVKPGALAAHIREVAEHGDATAVAALYDEAEQLQLIRLSRPSDTSRLYYVDGFDFGGGFYINSCTITVGLGDQASSTLHASVLKGSTIEDNPGEVRSFSRMGDVLYELYEPDRMLP